MPRLFIGIKIENQPNLTDLSNKLKQQLSNNPINWVDPNNFHLTLKFLGEVESFYINSLILLLKNISSKNKSFILQFNKLGYFGRKLLPSVIWFDFLPSEELKKLQQSVENSLLELGFPCDEKSYSPHLTLARIKKINNPDQFDELIKNSTSLKDKAVINEFQLIESTLEPSGSVYTIIERFKLQ
jgi:RNA 2',3'-cyclic 3'-phosphodiesterase